MSTHTNEHLFCNRYCVVLVLVVLFFFFFYIGGGDFM